MTSVKGYVDEPGMYLEAYLTPGEGHLLNMLIDSGATVSLMSSRVYEPIDARKSPKLRKVSSKITTVGGSNRRVHGRRYQWTF